MSNGQIYKVRQSMLFLVDISLSFPFLSCFHNFLSYFGYEEKIGSPINLTWKILQVIYIYKYPALL